MKRLQDNLGEFQDQTVQMTTLRGFADEMNREGADPKVLLAIGALIERIADTCRLAPSLPAGSSDSPGPRTANCSRRSLSPGSRRNVPLRSVVL